MKKNLMRKIYASVLCMLLVVVMAFTFIGCGKKEETNNSQVSSETSKNTENEKSNVLGKGNIKFTFKVVEMDGKETEFEIHTDKKTVGEALLEVNLIAGDESEYGLYVKTVNGITADYDKDKTYWAFYVGDEYATTGVDSTEVEAGKTYSFKVEK